MSLHATLIARPGTDRDEGATWTDLAIPTGIAVVLGAATLATSLLSNGNIVASVAPILGGVALWLMWIAPLRVTIGLVMLVALSVDRPGDADGRWESPFITIGGLLFHNLNHVINIDALKFSGVFAILAYLLLVRGYRMLTGRTRDTVGSLTPAAPMLWAMAAALVTVTASTLFGALRGGDVQMAKVQVQAFLQLLAVAYLLGYSLRGTPDYAWLGKLIVFAACAKATLAIWVRSVLPASFPGEGGFMRELEYTTNHGDSLVFACAIAVLLGPLFHRPARRHVAWFVLLTPLVLGGIVANDRRIAWVQVALVCAAYILLNPRSTVTRRLTRLGLLATPLLVVYTAVGWNSASRVFGPVSFIRNLVQPERSDGSLDRSTLFRDIENYNLVYTFMPNPVFGTGLGHPFEVAVQGDALPLFREYGFLPHNSVVGLWAFTGAAGFSGLFATVVVALLLAARAHARALTAEQAIAAAAAIGCLCSYVVHLWADIGFTEAPTIFLVGIAMAVAAQVAAATGAWPTRWREWDGRRQIFDARYAPSGEAQ